MNSISTGGVAELFGLPAHRLDYLTRDRQLRPPKGPTGAFVWSYAEVRRAASLLGLDPPTEAEFLARCSTGPARGTSTCPPEPARVRR